MTVIQEGRYRLRNVGSGLLLEVAGGKQRSGAKVRQGPADESPGQLWRITAVHPGGGLYHLESDGSGKRLDVTGARTDNGVPLQLWGPNSFGAQEWLLEQHVDAPGTFNLVSFISGLTLEIADDGTAQQWEDRDTPFQWWHLEPAE